MKEQAHTCSFFVAYVQPRKKVQPMKNKNLELLDISTLPTEGFVRIKTVLRVLPVSKSKWYQGIQDGEYPRSYKLSEGTSGWDVADIRKAFEQIKNKRKNR
jgi:prophage regulatory protein